MKELINKNRVSPKSLKWDIQIHELIPAFRPQLPTAEELLPWLRRIDQTRIYSNYGPLVVEFEQRLSTLLGLEDGQLVTASSGTAALVGGILAVAGRATTERPYALCPSYTFIGTASALQQCGYTPWFVDINAESWQIDPEMLVSHPQLNKVGVVVPVAPYGRPVPLVPWEHFQQATGIPVVIDGAAVIEGVMREPNKYFGRIPVALSFHATKVFATGEGGALLTSDPHMLANTASGLNFGFWGSRESQTPSINGKMSEYHAAVGLASLEKFDDYLLALSEISNVYREFFLSMGLKHHFYGYPLVASNYALFECESSNQARRISSELRDAGVETRFWYGQGLHRQPVFCEHAEQDRMNNTQYLSSRLLGLPMAPDLGVEKVQYIAASIRDIIT